MDIIYTNALVSNIEKTILKKIYGYSEFSNLTNLTNKITIKILDNCADIDVYCDTLHYILEKRMAPYNIQINNIRAHYSGPNWWCIGTPSVIIDIYFIESYQQKEYRLSI